MLGTASTRERSVSLLLLNSNAGMYDTFRSQRTTTSSPSTTSISTYNSPLFDAFPPPVPPLPKGASRRPAAPADVADVFSARPSISDDKPLPAIGDTERRSEATDISDDQSLVMVNPPHERRSRSPSPTQTVKEHPVKHPKVPTRSKRRSMSVSDAELKKAMAIGASPSPLRITTDARALEGSPGWGMRLEGIMSQFRGELEQLESRSTSLDLRDPTTPSKRPLAPRSQSDTITPLYAPPTNRPVPRTALTAPPEFGTPAVTLQTATGGEESLMDAGSSTPNSAVEASVSPTRSYLNIPSRSRTGSNAGSFQRSANLKYGPRSPQVRYGGPSLHHVPSVTRESNRLRVQHRSTASASEPSLIPDRDEGRVCEPHSVPFPTRTLLLTPIQCPVYPRLRSKTSRRMTLRRDGSHYAVRLGDRRKAVTSTIEGRSLPVGGGPKMRSSCRRTRLRSGSVDSKSWCGVEPRTA